MKVFLRKPPVSVLKTKFCRFSKIENEPLSFSTSESCFYKPTYSLVSAKAGRMFSIETKFNHNCSFMFFVEFFGFRNASFFKTNFGDLWTSENF